ncbi:thioredoxin, putative [Entamoeba histolytica HM-1:IMSS-B]|uniref:Thioredoxin, putative n=6 Tax=Entamoeba histolytica TaxID=5759 RepID=C4M0E3_ENTH1|nr:thioredoxin, putative [Entamoeba histolytica HM-1:IMSS]EMD48634.1 thioredoxin, putative [Entamoeba histolytica KU27]EMH74459.1 thioredoxin, putative [Entamoeba histolytica HM-1:IMSS-B]EMS15871.1 thioredoxin, putative [Entamoeba histolytica HM-3:IMSS]ENY60488.1 thioredoxin, putative [Entamoeba histolytica HM-1:IMSS-A]GAT94629.1 thioredoxin putative [Entamoeba histolytica]|eukprot:XP_654476.1 thioredoxin, putative [Entamoeba histolytica HM-1:IMSS]
MKVLFICLICVLVQSRSTPEEIDQYRNSSKLVVIEYMSEKCHFCQLIDKEMNETISELAMLNNIKIFQIDCDKHKSYCKRDGVSAYPTILPIRNNFMYNELKRPREGWNWKLQILEIANAPMPKYVVGRTKLNNTAVPKQNLKNPFMMNK